MDHRTAVDEAPFEVITEETDADWPEWEPVVEWKEYLHQDPSILLGKPVVRGTRLSAEFIVELFAGGWTEDLVIENYPQLTPEEIRAALALAAQCIRERYPVGKPPHGQ